MPKHIPRQFIKDLIDRIDITDVIHARVHLKKRGTNFIACCPFHQEKSPSFTVSQTKQFYHCFGCGVSGNALNFLMEFERLDFVNAVETLAAFAGVSVPYENVDAKEQTQEHQKTDLYSVLEKSSQFYQKQLLQSEEGKKSLTYLQNRGLTLETIKRFQLGHSPSGWHNLEKQAKNNKDILNQLTISGMLIKKEDGSFYDRFRERIMFPIHDRQGRVIAFGGRTLTDETPKYLNSPETPLFHKGQELYGLWQARQANRQLDSVIVVEGYMDTIALAQADFTNVVATLGTAATEEHLQRLLRYTTKIIFCFDGDNAGKKAAWRALETSLSVMRDGVEIQFIFLPESEDPDTYIQKYGKDAFTSLLQNTMPLSDFLIQHLCVSLDISTADGKAKLIDSAKPLLNKISNGIFLQLVEERLASILRISHTTLSQKLHPEKKSISKFTKKFSYSTTPKPATPLRSLLTLLLHQPKLYQEIKNHELLYKLQIPGSEVLQAILSVLKEQPELSTGALLEFFRESPHYAILLKLLAWDHLVPENGMIAEFLGALDRLNELICEQEVERLLSKASLSGLSDLERTNLQSLLQEQHKK